MQIKNIKSRLPIALLIITLILFIGHFFNVFTFRQLQQDETYQAAQLRKNIPQQIIDYSLDLWKGVDHLRKMHGCKDHEISFERKVISYNKELKVSHLTDIAINPNAPKNYRCHLFAQVNGANREFKEEFSGIKMRAPTVFSAELQILDMRNPIKYKDTKNRHNDLGMYMFVDKDICTSINKKLGMEKEGFVLENKLPQEEFKGTYRKVKSYAAPDDGETSPNITDLFREKADQMGCWKQTNSENYVFYLTLIRREG